MSTTHNDNGHNKLRTVRILVYSVLMLSAAGVFFGGDRLWAAAKVGDVPLWAPLVAPIAFTAFVVAYAVDRWLLVRRTRYPVTRAFFQVGFALVFLTMLWPTQTTQLRSARAWGSESDNALRLLQSPNPEVRALACEVLGLRGQIKALQTVEPMADEVGDGDPDEDVRAACARASEQLRALSPKPGRRPTDAP